MNKKRAFFLFIIIITSTLLIFSRARIHPNENLIPLLTQTGSSSALISPFNPFVNVCLSTASEKKLRGMYTIVDNDQVNLYDELLNLGAHCDKNNRLVNSKNTDIYVYQRHECMDAQKSNMDTVQIREQENQEIKRIQQSSIVIVLECQLE